MEYELYLRMPEAAERLSRKRASQALELAGFGPSAGLPARLDLGQGPLTASAYRRDEAMDPDLLDGINLGFPMGVDQAQGDRAVAIALALAGALGAELFDPQLGELVGPGDQERILRTWRRSYEFHASVVGAGELGAGSPVPLDERRSGLAPRVKVLLLLLGAFLLVVFLFRTCLSNWAERQSTAVFEPGLGPIDGRPEP
jgi:hypothetical protein